jgi:hypothetical protein
MDTQLRYYGRTRPALHCGTLNGRDVYLLDVDMLAPRTDASFGPAIVRRSEGTSEQATPVFLGAMDILGPVSAVVWSDSDAAVRAKAWVVEVCTERADKLRSIAENLRGPTSKLDTEVSPS